jgi:hypothetical protein
MKDDSTKPEDNTVPLSRRRTVAVAILIILTTLYTASVVAGYIPAERRIDVPTLAVVTFAVICIFLLINPGIFERLKIFEVSGFKLEMEQVKEKQLEQENKLADIALTLPLLLPKVEQKHLLNLADGTTADYKGGSTLRAELRRLRTAGLIRSHPNMNIGHLEDGKIVDLAKYVALEPLGERWVKRIREVEQAEAQEAIFGAKSQKVTQEVEAPRKVRPST